MDKINTYYGLFLIHIVSGKTGFHLGDKSPRIPAQKLKNACHKPIFVLF